MNYIPKEKTNGYFGQNDIETAKIIDAFLPDRLFDAHMHISHVPIMGRDTLKTSDYRDNMRMFVGERELSSNLIQIGRASCRERVSLCV